jgi:hypothetical protein
MWTLFFIISSNQSHFAFYIIFIIRCEKRRMDLSGMRIINRAGVYSDTPVPLTYSFGSNFIALSYTISV